MSTETLVAEKSQESSGLKANSLRNILAKRGNASASASNPLVPQVWCAPMTAAGEWVITWTRSFGTLFYEVQTSLDASQWSLGCKFSGTRAVMSVGPGRYCWARVRAIGPDGPGLWSLAAQGEQETSFPAAA